MTLVSASAACLALCPPLLAALTHSVLRDKKCHWVLDFEANFPGTR